MFIVVRLFLFPLDDLPGSAPNNAIKSKMFKFNFFMFNMNELFLLSLVEFKLLFRICSSLKITILRGYLRVPLAY